MAASNSVAPVMAPSSGARGCEECDAAVEPEARFCRECGAVQPTHDPATGEEPELAEEATSEGGVRCVSCQASLPGEDARFCRRCGARQPAGASAAEPAAPTPDAGALKVGQCRTCGATLVPDRRFCSTCGTAVLDGRSTDRAGVVRDPGWPKVVRSLTLVWEGTLTLIFAAITAAAAVTLLSLVDPDWKTADTLRIGLLGMAALAAAVGLGLILWGDVQGLAVPRVAHARIHALVVLALGAGAGLLGTIALAQLALVGFELAELSAGGQLVALGSLLLLLARLVAFSTLLRRLAFALRHYRIAQGAIGFVVFTGVGLGVVGLLNLLFRSATSAAQTLGELMGLAFVVLVALWSLTMMRRGRDLVRARLP